jgi:phenylacetate-CoA ligase
VVEVTAETLDMVGVVESDRIAVALNSDGAAVGTRWAEAAAGIASAAVAIGPARGGRILEVVDSVHATVLISTPTVAEELARVAGRTTSVHTVVLTGEVLDPGRRAAIGRHLGVAVGEVVLDPVFGAAVASRPPGATAFAVTRPGLVGSHRLDGGAIEWTLRCDWSPLLAGRDLRMGIAGPERRGPIDGTTWLPPPRWTIGDHVLVRGRWVSLSYLRRRLGPRGWCLAIRRGERADHSTLRVASAASLARVRRFVAEHLPVAHRVTVDPDLDGRPALVVDPQHLIGG